VCLSPQEYLGIEVTEAKLESMFRMYDKVRSIAL
jgi:hypothetical protein